MKNQKFRLEQIEIKIVDLQLMKAFIDFYEDCKQEFESYSKLCKQTRELLQISNDKSLETTLNNEKWNILNKLQKEKDNNIKEKLNNDYKNIDKRQKQINQYQKIIKLYNGFHSENLKEYSEALDEQKIKESINKRYPNYSEEAKKYQIRVEQQKYQDQQICSITQIYINIKFLYEVLEKVHNYQEKTKNKPFKIIQKIKLKRKLNQIKSIDNNEKYNYANIDRIEENINFFNRLNKPIEEFNKIYGPKIYEATKEAQREPEEIVLPDGITIINPKPKKPNSNYDDDVIFDRKKQIADLLAIRESLTDTNTEENVYQKTA